MTLVSRMVRTAVDGPRGGGSTRLGARSAGQRSWSESVWFGLVRSAATPYRVAIGVVTVVLGAVVAPVVAYGLPMAERTFEAVALQTQSAMSVTAPFAGVLLASDLRRWFGAARAASTPRGSARRRRGNAPAGMSTVDTAPAIAFPRQYRSTPGPTLVAAALVALAFALSGSFFTALVVGWTAPTGLHSWHRTGAIILGGVVVHLVAMFVGTGLGLLIQRRLVACAATIVIPLGLWLVLGLTSLTLPVRAWTTPYESTLRMLSGDAGALGWLQTLVVVLIWGVVLNAVGVRRLHRD